MRKEEYAEVRDVFLAALNAVEEACNVFYELAIDHKISVQKADDVPFALEDNGSWIGLELEDLHATKVTLELLVGRAHQRAT